MLHHGLRDINGLREKLRFVHLLLQGFDVTFYLFYCKQDIVFQGRPRHILSYLQDFLFSPKQSRTPVRALSGGERNRALLAKILLKPSNILVLDEPTNDLDVETLRALEEGLLAFPGSAIVVSHDRWFLDRICTHILAFEGDCEVVFHEGNYSDYETNRKKRLGDTAQPTRIKYKKLDG